MLISELEAKLKELREEHGNVKAYREYDGIAQDIEDYNIFFGSGPTTWTDDKDAPTATGIIINGY